MRVVALRLWCLVLACTAMTGFAAESRSFNQIVAAHTLRVGIFEAAPYVLKGADGKWTGSEVDVAQRLAKDLGASVEFKQFTQWDQLIPALQQGDIDIIVSGFSITPERALQVYFSNYYASSGIGIATNTKLTAGFSSLDSLNKPDVAIAVIAGSSSEQLARQVFDKASIKTFSEEARAEDALVKGLVHAYVRSEPAPHFLALRHPNEVDVPLSEPLLQTREAFAVRRGDNDFINFLNAWIAARTADGWLSDTRKYWFESLRWQDNKVAP